MHVRVPMPVLDHEAGTAAIRFRKVPSESVKTCLALTEYGSLNNDPSASFHCVPMWTSDFEVAWGCV